MRIKDLLEISFQNFNNRKSRIFFTILGVSIAIAAVLFLVSFGYGLQASLLKKITTKDSLLSLDVMSSDAQLIKLDQDTINKISAIEHVDKISPYVAYAGNLTINDLTSESMVNIVDDNYLKFNGVTPKVGRGFESSDINKVIVNKSVADLFNLSESDLLGKKINVTVFIPDTESENNGEEVKAQDLGKDFEIIGVIEDANNQGYLFIQKNDASISISEYSSIKVKIDNEVNLSETRDNLTSMGFLVSALSDTIDQANQIFGIIQIILGVFGTVALIVAAIGLINTMTISLLERTNEIGIMRATGASSSDVMWLFLGESLMIGFLGGLSGILLGIVISQLFQMIINLLSRSLGGEALSFFSYPIWFILFIIILSTLVGLISGFFPARRAAKLNPLDALRYK
jgi:ABC-type antimicrobial peptide transport system permease subunit